MSDRTYTTRSGDRLDTIAHAYYRDATAINQIIAANRSAIGMFPIPTSLPGGLLLTIPNVPDRQTQTQTTRIAPVWRR